MQRSAAAAVLFAVACAALCACSASASGCASLRQQGLSSTQLQVAEYVCGLGPQFLTFDPRGVSDVAAEQLSLSLTESLPDFTNLYGAQDTISFCSYLAGAEAALGGDSADGIEGSLYEIGAPSAGQYVQRLRTEMISTFDPYCGAGGFRSAAPRGSDDLFNTPAYQQFHPANGDYVNDGRRSDFYGMGQSTNQMINSLGH